MNWYFPKNLYHRYHSVKLGASSSVHGPLPNQPLGEREGNTGDKNPGNQYAEIQPNYHNA